MENFRKEDVGTTIGNFIQKNHKDRKLVEQPDRGFAIKEIPSIAIEEKSLKELGERWTFEGTAVIRKTDARNTVSTKSNCKIVGSAVVAFNRNDRNKNELLPEIENVTITKIEEL